MSCQDWRAPGLNPIEIKCNVRRESGDLVKRDLTYFAKSGNTQMVRLVDETKAKAELALESKDTQRGALKDQRGSKVDQERFSRQTLSSLFC